MTKDNFLMPDYYNQSKPKKEEILVDRKCYMCGVKAKMGKRQKTTRMVVEMERTGKVKWQSKKEKNL